MSYEEATKVLNSKERREFQTNLKQFIYLAERNEDNRFKQYLNNISNRVRITRYQALMTEIQSQIEELFGSENAGYQPQTYDLLSNTYTDSYYNTLYDLQTGTGIGRGFAILNRNAIDSVLEYPWSGQNFSDRIWGQKDKLILNTQNTITQGMVQGLSIDKMSQKLSKNMDVAYGNAERLVRTESNYILNQGTLKGYKEDGIERFEYVATLDSRTSEICQDNDGKVYGIENARVGVNVPPLHVRCRSTTVPYFEDQTSGQRAARNENGKTYNVSADMTYKEWYNKYADSEQEKENLASEVFKKMDKAPNELKQLASRYLTKDSIVFNEDKNKVAFYSPNTDRISINKENVKLTGMTNEEVLTHELGHKIDYNLPQDYELFSKIDILVKERLTVSYSTGFINSIEKTSKIIMENEDKFRNYAKILKDNGAISDIFSALTGNRIVGNFGHGNDYWAKEGKVEAETFANLFSIHAINDNTAINFIETEFEDLLNEFWNIIRSVTDE